MAALMGIAAPNREADLNAMLTKISYRGSAASIFPNSSSTIGLLLPILIFFARVFNVTLGTVRIIFIAHGKKFLAPLLGFVETFAWIMVLSQIAYSIHGIWSFMGCQPALPSPM